MSERYSGRVRCLEQPPHQKFTNVDWSASWAADAGDEAVVASGAQEVGR